LDDVRSVAIGSDECTVDPASASPSSVKCVTPSLAAGEYELSLTTHSRGNANSNGNKFTYQLTANAIQPDTGKES